MTSGVEQLTKKFRDLTPHSKMRVKEGTNAPPERLSLPCTIRISPEEDAPDDNNNNPGKNTELDVQITPDNEQTPQEQQLKTTYPCTCKDKFDYMAFLITHQSEEHNEFYCCRCCKTHFTSLEGMTAHWQADVTKVIVRTSTKEMLSAFPGADDGVCPNCKEGGHDGDTCPHPRVHTDPEDFLEAFPESRKAFGTLSGGRLYSILTRQWDYNLAKFLKSAARGAEDPALPMGILAQQWDPATPTTVEGAVIPQATETRGGQPDEEGNPVGPAVPGAVEYSPDVIIQSEPRKTVSPLKVIRLSTEKGQRTTSDRPRKLPRQDQTSRQHNEPGNCDNVERKRPR